MRNDCYGRLSTPPKMVAFQDYSVASASAAGPDGLRATVDCEAPFHASPLVSTCPNPPPPYSPASYDGRYRSHALLECVHARQLCEEHFANLEAKMADLDAYCRRSQCRCGRSNVSEGTCGQKRGQLQVTWCRTKSFFDSIRQRVSNKSRRRSQDAFENGQGQGHGQEPDCPGDIGQGHASDRTSEKGEGQGLHWLNDNLLLPSVAELPANSRPAELSPNYASLFELSAAYNTQLMPSPAGLPDVHSHDASHYANPIGHRQPSYALDAGMIAIPQALPNQHHNQIPGVYELPDQTLISASHTAPTPNSTLYGRPPPRNLAMSSFLRSTPTSHRQSVFSQSQNSSISTAVSSIAASVEQQGPLFASHTTYSPVEYGQNGDNVAAWLPAASSHDRWTSITAVAELPDSSLLPELEAIQWLPKPGSESHMPIHPPGTTSLPSAFDETRSIEPLSGGIVAQPGLDESGWLTSPVYGLGIANEIVNSGFMKPRSPSPPHSRLRRQPRIPRPRRNSSGYTTRSVPAMPTTEDLTSPEGLALPGRPRNSAISGLPSQQRVSKSKASGLRRRQAENESMYCRDCHYYPDEGPDQRKKMVRHNTSNRHRRNTGQEPGGGFQCPVCGSMHSRDDNRWQHVRKKHMMRRNELDETFKERIDARRDTGWALRADGLVGEDGAGGTG
ncbi:uncharacterized protein B0T15DRAFT_109693 [Chaetomium strumarium]|uniref:Uncharacterized protein n=1 Tax=Chaetomium strumarium TaxID=1170767 RepID=A0AAJ0GYM9_9PEZI|nr:hypothetical protein B0T15DRAFT_109693 [Chaetomium strumarium]